MNETKRKINTCVYVHSILHHWACILMFEGRFIEYVCWWELLCELSETLHYLYSCFIYFESEMSDLSLRSFVSLSFPSLHSLMMWLHFMLDLSESSLLFVFFASPSSSSHPLSFSYSDPYSQFDTSCVSSLHISLSDHFSSSPRYWYHIHVGHIQVHGSRASLYILHFIHKGMSFDHWVFGSSFPSFLSPYHPSLRYVPCLKTTLRPWDQMSSSTASAWTGVWDLVAF